MKLSILASLVLTVLFSSTIILSTVDAAERSRMGTAGSSPAGLRTTAPAVTPTTAPKKPEPWIEETRMSGTMPCPDSAGGCCGKPIPFPGLHCCDTQDCGWYKCDEDSVRMNMKMYR